MSRFSKLAHSIWHCHYHIVWTPKYRFRILIEEVKEEIEKSIIIYSEQLKCKIIEMNVQDDHVHLLLMVPPKESISDVVGTLKGRSAIRVFNLIPQLRKRYWGNHFWARGYCVDTVGLNLEMIRNYVKYQEKKERQLEIRDR
jgi:putative transposase